jgi:mercuric ion binding protein
MKRQRLIFWSVSAALLALLSVPWLAPFLLWRVRLMRNSVVSLLLAGMALAALAATPQTAVLDLQNMTCALCSVTVRKALENVSGVSQARVDFVKKSAIVTFDADRTNAATLVKATADAGFPAEVRP